MDYTCNVRFLLDGRLVHCDLLVGHIGSANGEHIADRRFPRYAKATHQSPFTRRAMDATLPAKVIR